MKKTIFTLFAAIMLSGLFFSCAEEEITPSETLNTGEVVGQGVQKDDKGF